MAAAVPVPEAGAAVAEARSVGECLAAGAKALRGVDSARLDTELLLAHALGARRSAVLAFPERAVAPGEADVFACLVARRARGEPIAYLTGRREFYSLPLDVGPEVLVPRPETEVLVEAALRHCERMTTPRLLDVGTGSGAIALAVASERPGMSVTACDVSAAALAVARSNAARFGLNVRFVESRWLDAFANRAFDVIVSNPPYLRSDEVGGPLAFEPRLALDGGADGLDAYRALLVAAPARLASGGVVLLEHGHEQRLALVALARSTGWRVLGTHDDLARLPRVIELARSDST
jgi:release factor glutamine methyltransferase